MQAVEDAIAGGVETTIAWALSQLDDVKPYTVREMRKALADYELPPRALFDAVCSMQKARDDGRLFKSDAGYVVGALQAMGREGHYRSAA